MRSPADAPWQADTIFGHLCWLERHREGETALRDFLEPFKEGEPSFLLSDGFPGDLLPKPLFFKPPSEDKRDSFREGRRVRKLKYFSYAEFLRAIGGERFVPAEIQEASKQHPSRGRELPPRVVVALKNQVSRLTGTTGEAGTLFSVIECWMPEVTLYLKITGDYDVEHLKQLFTWLAASGYGKRKSVGYGAIVDHEFDEFPGFTEPAQANGFVSLSSFVPAENDPVDGAWQTRIKYGRLGEEYAVSEVPFKRPVMMFTAGSAFRDAPIIKDVYGRMVTNVSPAHPEVVQYGYALPVPCVCKA